MKNDKLAFGFVSILIMSIIIASYSKPLFAFDSLQEYLQAFQNNPALMAERRPDFVDENGQTHSRGYIRPDESVADVRLRNEYRLLIMNVASSPAPNATNTKRVDAPEVLVDPGTLVYSLREMQLQNLAVGGAADGVWADSYWPFRKGLIGFRYADPKVISTKNWETNLAYYNDNPPEAIVAEGNAEAIDVLSPAEKYDILVGDTNFSLTKYSWSQGSKYIKGANGVPSWAGICHGWAAAASMKVAIPTGSLTFKSPSGLSVNFYPQDVKALQSMLWANSPPKTRFVGDRCEIAKLPRDSVGRIIDDACRGVNPSTWHVALINQLGVHHRSFVMDLGHDAEIWNYPVVSYRYHYFNPQTWQEGSSLRFTAIPLKDFTIDKFSDHRSPDAHFIIGVSLDITYLVEVIPTRKAMPNAPSKTLRLIYDLELDDNMNIIGQGEWYSNSHPDFIWTFAADAQAVTFADPAFSTQVWDISDPIPISWREAAANASAHGSPLSSILHHFQEQP